WFSVQAVFGHFGALTALFRVPKMVPFYAPPNALGSTLDFGVFGSAHCCKCVAVGMDSAALFAAVSIHCCILPRSGAHSAGRSESNRGCCRWHCDGHHRIG